MLLAYVAAFGSAVLYGLASILQSMGARRVAAGDTIDPRGLAKVATQGPYLVGLGLDGVSWLLSLVALSRLPVFVVQAVVAGAIGFVVLFAYWLEDVRPTRRQLQLVAVLFVGLFALAWSGAPEAARATPPAFSWGMWAGVVIVGIAGVLVPRVLADRHASAVLGALAGLAFGGTALCARSLVSEISIGDVADPLLWAMAAYGALGLVFYAAALQRGQAMAATAALFTAETVVPAIIGMAVLGDSARSGMVWLAVLAFVVAVAAAVILALVSPPLEE